MGLFTAEYSTSYNGNEIAVSGNLEGAMTPKAAGGRIKLYINGSMVDEFTVHALASFFGCRLSLRGSLPSGEIVKYTFVNSCLRRPLHTITINDQVIFEKKGTWGGM